MSKKPMSYHTLTLEYAFYPNDSEVSSCYCSCGWRARWGARNGLLIMECAAQFDKHVANPYGSNQEDAG